MLGVLARLGSSGHAIASRGTTTYVDVDGFVVVMTPPGVPRLPNSICGPINAPMRIWDPTLTLPGRDRPRRLMSRFGLDVDALFLDDEAARGARALIGSITSRDVDAASKGLLLLIGRGPGLTPMGDDFAAGVIAVVAASARRHPLLSALKNLRVRRRTTSLSATLLELAARAQVPEALLRAYSSDARTGMADLLRIGHSTGRAYATGAVSAAAALLE